VFQGKCNANWRPYNFARRGLLTRTILWIHSKSRYYNTQTIPNLKFIWEMRVKKYFGEKSIITNNLMKKRSKCRKIFFLTGAGILCKNFETFLFKSLFLYKFN